MRAQGALTAFVALAMALGCAAGCRPKPPGEPRSATPQRSDAADAIISKAPAEVRPDLEKARDTIDAEGRKVAAERDAEIRRLKQENEQLKKQLGAR